MRLSTLAALILCMVGVAGSQAADLTSEMRDYVYSELHRATGLLSARQTADALATMETLRNIPGIASDDEIWISLNYNAACAYSLTDQPDSAFARLCAAIDAGWTNPAHLRKDTDLDNIRSDPRFDSLLAFLDAKATFWDNDAFTSPYADTLSTVQKVAGLSKLWSEVKFDFAFFDRRPDVRWDSLYMAYLPRVIAAATTLDYYNLLTELCAQLRDGHTSVTPPRALWDRVWSGMPFVTQLIEGHVVVVRVLNDEWRKQGITQGAELTEIDGLPVAEYVDCYVRPYANASTPQALNEQLYHYSLFHGRGGDTLTLVFAQSSGRPVTLRVPCGDVDWPGRPDVEYKRLKHNIAYVALNTFGRNDVVAQFDSVFQQAASSDGLILDVRRNTGGNSSVGFEILRYLADADFETLKWRCRDYRAPYRAWQRGQQWYNQNANGYSPKPEAHYAGPVVLLIGPNTGSAAEDFCVVFDVMKRGTMIGEPTNGSTGQPLHFVLPGGGSARVCTLETLYPDGRQFVGVGVQPDVTVTRTVDDVRSGRDPVLDAAIKYLRASGT